MKIKVDELSAVVELELENYAGEVRSGLVDAVKDISAQCLHKIRRASPKKTGQYAKGWRRRLNTSPRNPSAIIYNDLKPWLTHILEDGYQKRSGGRVEGRPHIRPAAQEAAEELVAAAEQLVQGE